MSFKEALDNAAKKSGVKGKGKPFPKGKFPAGGKGKPFPSKGKGKPSDKDTKKPGSKGKRSCK